MRGWQPPQRRPRQTWRTPRPHYRRIPVSVGLALVVGGLGLWAFIWVVQTFSWLVPVLMLGVLFLVAWGVERAHTRE